MSDQDLREKQKIVLLLTQMQAKLDAAEQRAQLAQQPIAVIGIGCRMPGGVNSADSFWAMLEAGVDAVIDVPPERWDADQWYDPDPDAPGKMNTRRGGFLHDIDKFDAEFFGISPREAISMDPQQRLVLEVAWRALEHANVAPQSLAGSSSGVFLGICTSDYARMGDGSGSMGALDTYSGTGGANGVAAGRLSYTLGLQGPSMVIDTACSSSLVATHLAVQSLRSGECRLALAGGVNLVLLPDGTVTLSRLHMMAPDGRCKAFDASANGFVRGEGCGIVVLKRLADAEADGDRVLAVIRGSAVNQDGRSAGLTAPNGLAQQAVVREALANARVNPADIAYVEAHGTGTALGDPVEMNALASVLGVGRTQPLLVGSVKTNIGHLEAAAGIAGLIKAIETVRRGRVAPSLHFHQINPHIRTGDCAVSVPVEPADFGADVRRLAGVSAFGFSGTNAHLVLEGVGDPLQTGANESGSGRAAGGGENSNDRLVPAAARPVEVLTLSAKTATALAELKAAFIASPALEQFADACFTAATGRNAFAHRIAVVADTRASAIEQLAKASGRIAAAPRIAFLFSGQGAQASGMGQHEYATEPVFRAVLDRCAVVLDPLLGRSLTALMFEGGADLNRTEFAQPALMAYELAMVALLRSWGVEPEALLGHSLGEYVAATVAESLPFDDALRLVARRGRLMQSLPAGGAMAAVLSGREHVDRLLASNPELSMAADNGPGMVTISGPEAAIEAACAALNAQGIETRRLPVSHAFHSALMDPALDEIEAAAARVAWQAPRVPVIGNLDGAQLERFDAAYWRRHTRAPVAFAAGVRELLARGCNIIVEVGPNPVLLSAARSCATDPSSVEWIAASRVGQNASNMKALASLFEAGVELRWNQVHAGRGRNKVALPGHPMRRVSYWRALSAAAAQAEHPLLRTRVDLADGRTAFRIRLPDAALAQLAEHRVGAQAIAPAALLLEACASAAARCGHASSLSAVAFDSPLLLDTQQNLARELTIEVDASQVTLQSRSANGGAWTRHMAAQLGQHAAKEIPPARQVSVSEAPHPVDPLALHAWMQAGGIEYGPIFRRIQLASRGQGVALAGLQAIESGPYRLHPALLDAAFQALAVATFETGDGLMRIPVGLDYFEVAEPFAFDEAWAHVRLHSVGVTESATKSASVSADVFVCDGQGRMLARAHGLQLGRSGAQSSWQDSLLEKHWRARPMPLTPEQLAQHAASAFTDVSVQASLSSLAGLGQGMDVVSAAYATQALAVVKPEEVAAQHRALHRRLPLLAAAAGANVSANTSAADPEQLLSDLSRRYPDSQRELSLLQRCGSRLASVLTGQQDPLQLLFPAENQDNVYRDSPVSRALNRGVEDAVLAALPHEGPLRILEVGAGTGGTTDGLLARLPVDRIEEYAFTDISPTLLAAAGRRHATQTWLQPRRFDIDGDPIAQGFAEGRYDIIVAANVIHAGADLKSSLKSLQRLLAPNGVLVMLEGAGPQGWIDLVFGLTEGWWRFTDHERRPDYPLPDRTGWLQVLDEAGLQACAVEAQIEDVLERQLILVARRKLAEKWLVVGGDDAVTQALAESLRTKQVDLDVEMPLGDWYGCVFTGALQIATSPNSLDELMADQQRMLESQRRIAMTCSERGMQMAIVTRGALAACATQATAWGLGRAIAVELPELHARLIDLDAALALEQAAHLLRAELDCKDGEDQVSHADSGRRVARLVRMTPSTAREISTPAALDPEATFLITGGFGGLGLHAARWLAGRGARCLVLMGRSAPSPQALQAISQLESEGVQVFQCIGDVALEDDVRAALKVSARRIAGVVHAAGTLDDGVLAQLDWQRMERVLRAKVAGAWLLDRLAGDLDFMLLYSSAVGLVGSRGQANHVAANAFLDALAAQRRASGRCATSIAWGAWSEIGSATDPALQQRLRLSGMDSIAPAQARQVLDWVLDSTMAESSGEGANVPPGFGMLPIRWPAFTRAISGAVPPILRELLPALPQRRASPITARLADAPTQKSNAAQSIRPQRMLDILLAEAAAVLAADGPHAIDPARSLFELGLDSLMAVELRNRLQLKLGRTLPSTLLFDHPTPSGLAAFLGDGQEAASPEVTRAASNEPIAIVGMDCRFPGGASDPERFWQLLCEGFDAIGNYPASRAADSQLDRAATTPQGAFLDNVDLFDAAFFRIAPREAASMDPQQRLLLETAWHALERSGHAPDNLNGTSTGVFVGVCNYDYPQLVTSAGQIDAWSATGGAPSIVAGRLAYVLGLEGPAMVVDTACSSSLVTVHLACQSLLAGDCDMALAGGVNLILTGSSTEALSTLHMLAPDSRCKSFDSRADGFVRGEGCGVIVLKRLSDAMADGDNVMAVIRGSYVNQDGRSPSLTAPSGRSQESVIRHALSRAGVAPAEVGYVETHGTCTQLGDPIEIHALKAVFGATRTASAPLVVGAVKSNIGHLEAAAGIAGLIKATLAISHARIPPNLHFTQMNPHISLDGLAARFPVALTDWPQQGVRMAGVSAFGFSGTNAHVVLQQAPEPTAIPQAARHLPQLLVASGATPEAARAMAHALADQLSAADTPSLADLAYTMIAGRAQLDWRIAVVASNAADAAAALRAAQPQPASTQAPRVAFVIRGQKLPGAAVLESLYRAQPVFRAAIDEVGAVLESGTPQSLTETLFGTQRENQKAVAHFAYGYAVCKLLAAWGIAPQAFMVDGCGKEVAACISKSISLADAVRRVYQREAGGLSHAQFNEGSIPTAGASDEAQVAALACDLFLTIDGDAFEHVGSINIRSHGLNSQSGDDEAFMLDALAALQVAGCRLSPLAMRAAGARLLTDAPVYPFQRERHWVDSAARPSASATVKVADGFANGHPLLGELQRSPGRARRYQSLLSVERLPWLAEHRVAGAATLPAAAMLEIMAATGPRDKAFAVEQIEFIALLDLSAAMLLQTEVDVTLIELHATAATADNWRPIASGSIVTTVSAQSNSPSLASLREKFTRQIDVAAFYAAFEHASALDYGPAFRTVHQLCKCDDAGEALARLVLPDGLDTQAMRLHPALLDGAFQSVGEAAAGMPGITGAYLPTGIARFTWLAALAPTELWAWTRVQKRHDGALLADIDLFSAQGELVARAEQLLLQPTRAGSGRRAFLHDLSWRAAETGQVLPTRWHLLECDAVPAEFSKNLVRRLATRGLELVALAEAQAVVFFAAPCELDVAQPCVELLELAQQLIRLPAPPQLWIVTIDAATLQDQNDMSCSGLAMASSAATWGFAASLRLEHPELSVTVVDLPGHAVQSNDAALLEQALSCQGAVLAARSAGIFVRHTVPHPSVGPGGRFALQRPDNLQIQSLGFEAVASLVPGPDQVAIAVAAAGLNFRDLMNVLGTYPGAAGLLGGECAGHVTALGENVRGLQVGQAVMAISAGCQASHVLAPAPLVLPVPRGWSMEQAGSSPTVFLTAARALRGPGLIAAGQKVLIHSGTGGLGLAAIQIARAAGAEVFATAGSEEKRAYLRAMGIACVSDSRSLAFVDAVREHTGGQGVDIVLNALSGDLIAGGFAVLRAGGRFLEAGKAGIWSASQAHACRADVAYHRIALDEQIVHEPEVVGQMWRGLLSEFEQGALTPLPVTNFSLNDAEAVREAYRYMQHARHIGRIVLTRRWLRGDAAYLVTGGTGALGLACAAWLVERGAGTVVLAARRTPDEQTSGGIAALRAMGARIEIVQADVAQRAEVDALIAGIAAPLAGVIHAAGVIDDGVVQGLTPEKLRAVFAPKVMGAIHLDAATRQSPLDFFVLFSSAAGVLGSAGQANYAAANAALDGIARSRRALGLPALSIDWGAWAGGGLAAQRGGVAMASEHALAALEELLQTGASQMLVLPESLGTAAQGTSAAPEAKQDAGLRAALAAVSSGEQRALLADAVRRQAATILSLPEATLKTQRPLNEYGLDSLMAVELRNALSTLADSRLPSSLLFDYPNIEALANFLAERMDLLSHAHASDRQSLPPLPSVGEGQGEGAHTSQTTPAEAASVPTNAHQTQQDAAQTDAEFDNENSSEAELAEALRKELERAGY
ncbi:hypothetical protein BH11PSE11_BH11PSE11_04980 [soil metagenome]